MAGVGPLTAMRVGSESNAQPVVDIEKCSFTCFKSGVSQVHVRNFSCSIRVQSRNELLKWCLSAVYITKSGAVSEFLVPEEEAVVNIHKRLWYVYESCPVSGSTVGLWAKRFKTFWK